MATVIELPITSYEGIIDSDWCPGCGDFGVLKALKVAAGKLGIKPKDLIVVSGIGCSSNLPGFIHTYGVHSLHGRAVTVAEGIKLANHDLNVVITGGDGDGAEVHEVDEVGVVAEGGVEFEGRFFDFVDAVGGADGGEH